MLGGGGGHIIFKTAMAAFVADGGAGSASPSASSEAVMQQQLQQLPVRSLRALGAFIARTEQQLREQQTEHTRAAAAAVAAAEEATAAAGAASLSAGEEDDDVVRERAVRDARQQFLHIAEAVSSIATKMGMIGNSYVSGSAGGGGERAGGASEQKADSSSSGSSSGGGGDGGCGDQAGNEEDLEPDEVIASIVKEGATVVGSFSCAALLLAEVSHCPPLATEVMIAARAVLAATGELVELMDRAAHPARFTSSTASPLVVDTSKMSVKAGAVWSTCEACPKVSRDRATAVRKRLMQINLGTKHIVDEFAGYMQQSVANPLEDEEAESAADIGKAEEGDGGLIDDFEDFDDGDHRYKRTEMPVVESCLALLRAHRRATRVVIDCVAASASAPRWFVAAALPQCESTGKLALDLGANLYPEIEPEELHPQAVELHALLTALVAQAEAHATVEDTQAIERVAACREALSSWEPPPMSI